MRKKIQKYFWPYIILFALVGLVTFASYSWLRRGEPAQAPAPATLAAQVTETAASPTGLPPATVTAEPTETLEPTLVPTLFPAEPKPEPKLYGLQFGTPVYTRAFAHYEEGCAWLGVAGQIFQRDGAAASNVAVLVTGKLIGEWVERAVVTTPDSIYGPGGFEIQLTDSLPGATSSFIIQLYDLQSLPLSDPVAVRVPERCEQNLVLVNFRAGAAGVQRYFLPVTSSQKQP